MDEEQQEATNPSHDLDLVTIFAADGTTAEMQSLEVQAVLESNGIPTVIVGASTIPSLPFEVRVPKDQSEQALTILAEAQAAGPEAAEEAVEGSQEEA